MNSLKLTSNPTRLVAEICCPRSALSSRPKTCPKIDPIMPKKQAQICPKKRPKHTIRVKTHKFGHCSSQSSYFPSRHSGAAITATSQQLMKRCDNPVDSDAWCENLKFPSGALLVIRVLYPREATDLTNRRPWCYFIIWYDFHLHNIFLIPLMMIRLTMKQNRESNSHKPILKSESSAWFHCIPWFISSGMMRFPVNSQECDLKLHNLKL